MVAKDQWKKSSVTGAAGVHVYFQILFLKIWQGYEQIGQLMYWNSALNKHLNKALGNN